MGKGILFLKGEGGEQKRKKGKGTEKEERDGKEKEANNCLQSACHHHIRKLSRKYM